MKDLHSAIKERQEEILRLQDEIATLTRAAELLERPGVLFVAPNPNSTLSKPVAGAPVQQPTEKVFATFP